VRNRGVLVPMLEEVMKTRRKSEWLPALEAAKVPCGAINNLAEVFADPQVRERGMVHQWEHPLAGPLPLVASPLKLGARRSAPTPAAAAGRAHRAGAVRGAGLESGTHRGAARAGGDLMADFVLVHGAWHGGWCWRRVVDALHAQGHRAFAVTLTGLGERAHLMSPLITLETHIADVANLFEAEDCRTRCLPCTPTPA
jgi:hypothetical protein